MEIQKLVDNKAINDDKRGQNINSLSFQFNTSRGRDVGRT